MMETLQVLLVCSLLLVSVEHSESGQCFAYFNTTSGECTQDLGEAQKSQCCQNPTYGYRESDGECQFCGPPVWSPWTSWSLCNILCGGGVITRTRKCFGKSECENPKEKLHMEPCNSTCCSDKEGWAMWLEWSPCSVTCGGPALVGFRTRKRVCNSSPECGLACEGPSEQTEKCESLNKCPVHGIWSGWSQWSQCSGPCVDKRSSNVIMPIRTRQHTCSNPAPSTDTQPHGDSCPGDSSEQQDCIELPNCPVDGKWGAWLPLGPCSVTCGQGLQLSNRKCENPVPEYGGKYCEGESTKTSVCHSPCPVHGVWTNWSNWSECSAACILQGEIPKRTRRRSCTNPAPSSNPAGQPCNGEDSQVEDCTRLPYCPVNGNWGQWSSYTPCPVTCGMGQQVKTRTCDNPAAQHGGKECPGTSRETLTCSTNVQCPVNGVWSDWTAWGECYSPYEGRTINCKTSGGKNNRTRTCLHREHGGALCEGDQLSEIRVCYDVNGCPFKGKWDGWESWNYCTPPCGSASKRIRKRKCKPDYSEYRPTIRSKVATFVGKPDCGDPPDGIKSERQQCNNAPPC
ncbi:properdin-like [Melanotaenia boesemani]|uniref:properdin-like n=1 Tax=Melanotaenia boesemani TaxID=1250792 RepID=UPI001C0516AF|nr:properdin-like [Melanotaenia boesemani]